MDSLKERILKDGMALNETVLKVDSFLNHGVDAQLMYEIGTEFKNYFMNHGITKIFTIESSGIAPTVMTAIQMNLPMVTLKKQTSKLLKDDIYQTTVHSFTKATDYELTLSKKYISNEDKVLIIDDFSITIPIPATCAPASSTKRMAPSAASPFAKKSSIINTLY